MDSHDSDGKYEAERIRALLLGLRYLYNIPKNTKSMILELLTTQAPASNSLLYEQISKLLIDQQCTDIDGLSRMLDKSTNALQRLKTSGISALMIQEKTYPSRFKSLTDAPFVLMAKGNLMALNPEKSIAVIGTRNVDDIIYNAGIDMSMNLAQRGWMIASGLAKGCDSAGHIGCLRGQGITTAILPSSIEKIYPADNKGLADEIVANGGCLITEYLSSDKIQRYFFVQRDRLQAALSDFLLVLQTGIKGGTMHTVRYAHQYGKPVIAYIPEERPSQIDISGNIHLVDKDKALRADNLESLIAILESNLLTPDNSKKSMTEAHRDTDEKNDGIDVQTEIFEML